MNWYVLKAPNLSLGIREELKRMGVQFFLPTQTQRVRIGGKDRTVERPIVFNFLFVYWTQEEVKSFLHTSPQWKLHIVYSHRTIDGKPGTPLIVPDLQMKMFVRTVGEYRDASIPYISPAQVDMEEGDWVRIVGGPFDGVEGRLISQQGKKGGKVLVSISELLCVPTLHIEPECLQVIEFAKGKKHLYKQMDAYQVRLDAVLRGEERLDCVELFVRRFACLRTNTLNAEAKFLALLHASYRLLQNQGKLEEVAARLDEVLPQVTSEQTLAFVKKYVHS